jgi:hypothetical protein
LELLVDGQPHDDLKGQPFVKTLELVRKELSGSGRALMAIFLDGRELSVEEENALALRPVEELGRVELRSTPAREWGLHGLGEVASALGQLGDQFRSCSDLFRNAKLVEGLDRSNETIAIFLKVMQALGTSISLAGVANAGAGGLKGAVDAVVAAMRDLEAAVRGADGVAAADIAEYQLPEAMEALAAQVRALATATQPKPDA